jgi:hypothetical protein
MDGNLLVQNTRSRNKCSGEADTEPWGEASESAMKIQDRRVGWCLLGVYSDLSEQNGCRI